MSAVSDNALRIIRNSINRSPCSNCVRPWDDVVHGLEQGSVAAVSEANPVILVEKKKEFYQLYYFWDRALDITPSSITGWKAVADKIAGYKPLYADITVKGDFEYSGSVFEKLGLKPFRVYVRLQRRELSRKKYKEYGKPDFAKESDLERIQALLRGTPTFDVMADHLPDDEELRRLLLNNNVLILEVGGELAGVDTFKNIGAKSLGGPLCVAEKFQGKVVGYSLFANYINRFMDTVRLFETWVNRENESAYKLNTAMGYREDGMKNYIFRNC